LRYNVSRIGHDTQRVKQVAFHRQVVAPNFSSTLLSN